jgi:hypothetical protein
LVLPFNKNKWSIVIEPTYQNYTAEKTIESDVTVGDKLVSKVSYHAIEVSLSLRHYFYINNNSKVFVNGTFLIDTTVDPFLRYDRIDNSNIHSLPINPDTLLTLGVGYKLNDKYIIEIRYLPKRKFLHSVFWESNYKTFSVIFGYTIF